jgi:Cu/Ag efflux protein CusF
VSESGEVKMKKLIIPAVAVALVAFVSSANAASATGTIKSIDATKDTIVLNDGTVYSAPATVKIAQFKVGEKVTVTYEKQNGKMELSGLVPAT